jgi:hypothetical protein
MIRFELHFESNRDIQNKIVSVTKENAQLMGQKSGTEPSLTDDDITNYPNRVINEVKQRREDRTPEVVGSNPTRSIFFYYEGTTVLF